MVLRRLVVALAICAALPAGAMALDKGVILDRGPVAKEYSLPLDAQRTSLSGLSKSALHSDAVRAGRAAPGSAAAPGPLFGFGILSQAVSRAVLKSDVDALATTPGHGVLASLLPSSQRSTLQAAGRTAARIPDSSVFGGGGGIAAGLVLLAGALGAWTLRRLRLI